MNATLPMRVLLAIACCVVVPRAFAAEECTVSTTGVNFGTYDPTSGTAVTAQGTIEVLCRGNPLSVTIAIGTGSSNSFANRQMTNGTNTLFYNLYTTAARTTIFGDGMGGSSTATCTTGTTGNNCTGDNPSGSDRRAIRPVYGLMPASQAAGPGTYTDTLTYSVTF